MSSSLCSTAEILPHLLDSKKTTTTVQRCFKKCIKLLPTLLYSAETYTLYQRHFRTLSLVHLRHIRQILRISWKDHIPNVEVLRRANLPSIKATLTASQLHCTGHIIRTNDSRLPKAMFYEELSKGQRLHGGQRLRYKDVVK